MDAAILESGHFYLIADCLIAVLTLLLTAVAECITIPIGKAQLSGGRATEG